MNPHAFPVRRTALMVLNPRSARAGQADLDPFLEQLARENIVVETVTLGESPECQETLARARGRVDLVIVGGGDGTIRSAASALVDLGLPVGLLPLGTANDLARGLGIPMDLEAAARVIVGGETRWIDLAVANDHLYFNAAGIGLGPALTRAMDASEKQSIGVLAYLKALLRTVKDQESFPVEIECDGERLELRVLQLTIANGRYYGGGMTAGSEARVDDGMLDLLAVRADGLIDLIRLGPSLRWPREQLPPEIIARRGRAIRVRTRRPMRVTTDGDFTTETPVEFSVRPRLLRVFTGGEGDAIRGRSRSEPAARREAGTGSARLGERQT